LNEEILLNAIENCGTKRLFTMLHDKIWSFVGYKHLLSGK